MVTPLFAVLVAIGSVDLLFALDSIPAVFGVTEEPFIVFTANAFALLGLRALFLPRQGLARPVGLPVHRVVNDSGLHRRPAGVALGPCRHRQTDTGDFHLCQPRRDRRGPRRGDHREPDQDPSRPHGQGPSCAYRRSHRRMAAAGEVLAARRTVRDLSVGPDVRKPWSTSPQRCAGRYRNY